MDWMQRIQKCFEAGTVFYSRHAKLEMEYEEFGRIFEHEVYESICNEVYESICNGEVIEEYSEDKPYPSVLIYGETAAHRPLHIVCAYDETEKLTIVITVYHPNPELWIDYKRRRKP